MNKLANAFISVCVLSACQTSMGNVQRPPLPSSKEIETYVSQNWDRFVTGFARRSNRGGERVTLVSVAHQNCDNSRFVLDCSVEVTGEFPDGERATMTLKPTLDRNEEGQLDGPFLVLETN